MTLRELFQEYVAERKTLSLPGYRLDSVEGLTRHTPLAPDLDGIVAFSELTEASVEKAIADQVAYFSGIGRSFEWKVHAFDTPDDLMARLRRHGFEPGATEVLMVYSVKDRVFSAREQAVRCERVTTAEGIRDVVVVQTKVWGGHLPWLETVLHGLLPHALVLCAYHGDTPVATGWIEFPPGARFAELHGGAVLAEYRGRGIYSALFELRVEEARRRDIPFLAVDAAPMSRPILLRKGFVPVCETIPFRKQPVLPSPR